MQCGARIQQIPCSMHSPCWDTEQDPTPHLEKHFPRQAINTGAAIPSGTAAGSPQGGEEPGQADLGQQNWEQNTIPANAGPRMRCRKDVSHRTKASAFSSTRVELFSPEISFFGQPREHMLFQAKHAWVALAGRDLSQALLTGKATAPTCPQAPAEQRRGKSGGEGEAATPALLLPREMIKKRARPSPAARDARHRPDGSEPGLPSLPRRDGKPIKRCEQRSLRRSSLEALSQST